MRKQSVSDKLEETIKLLARSNQVIQGLNEVDDVQKKQIAQLKTENRELRKYEKFYRHIRDCVDDELSTNNHVLCKICNKTFEQITGVEESEQGNPYNSDSKKCEMCNGTGEVRKRHCIGDVLHTIPCEKCGGSGGSVEEHTPQSQVEQLQAENDELRVELSQWQCGAMTLDKYEAN